MGCWPYNECYLSLLLLCWYACCCAWVYPDMWCLSAACHESVYMWIARLHRRNPFLHPFWEKLESFGICILLCLRVVYISLLSFYLLLPTPSLLLVRTCNAIAIYHPHHDKPSQLAILICNWLLLRTTWQACYILVLMQSERAYCRQVC